MRMDTDISNGRCGPTVQQVEQAEVDQRLLGENQFCMSCLAVWPVGGAFSGSI